MQLTNQQLKNEKHDASRTRKIFDGGGLFIEITPSGSKRWRLKYRFAGKEKLISLGIYPAVTLKDARQKRDDAKRLIAQGFDPSAHRKNLKVASDRENQGHFERIATEWVEQNKDVWANSHAKTIKLRLKNDVIPFIGKRSIKEITSADVLVLLRRIEAREAYETAHRVRTNLSQIFRYAISCGYAELDPTRDLRGALKPVKTEHLPAITEPKEVGNLLRMIDAYRGGPIVTSALRLAPHVFVRPGELRSAEWEHFDLDQGEWHFTVQKTNTPHIVPLSTQAISILRDIQPITGSSKYVFPSPRSFTRPMSDNAILAALRSLNIPKDEMCGHGFRAMARTLLDEVLGFAPHLIEHQLAHSVKDQLGRAYNRTKHLPERRHMMQIWSDYLHKIKEN